MRPRSARTPGSPSIQALSESATSNGANMPTNNNTARVRVCSGIGTVMRGIQQLQVTAKVSRKNIGAEPHTVRLVVVETNVGFGSGCDSPVLISGVGTEPT